MHALCLQEAALAAPAPACPQAVHSRPLLYKGIRLLTICLLYNRADDYRLVFIRLWSQIGLF